MRRTILSIAVLLLLAVGVTELSAQARQRVRFARGALSTRLTGSIRGYAYRDYVVGASAGQTISVHLRSSRRPGVFTIFLPDGDNLEGAAEMDSFDGELPASGDYVIRVLMMRSQARRPGAVSNYSLSISIR